MTVTIITQYQKGYSPITYNIIVIPKFMIGIPILKLLSFHNSMNIQ